MHSRSFLSLLVAGGRPQRRKEILSVAIRRWPKEYRLSGRLFEKWRQAVSVHRRVIASSRLISLDARTRATTSQGIARPRNLLMNRGWTQSREEPKEIHCCPRLLSSVHERFQSSEKKSLGRKRVSQRRRIPREVPAWRWRVTRNKRMAIGLASDNNPPRDLRWPSLDCYARDYECVRHLRARFFHILKMPWSRD